MSEEEQQTNRPAEGAQEAPSEPQEGIVHIGDIGAGDNADWLKTTEQGMRVGVGDGLVLGDVGAPAVTPPTTSSNGIFIMDEINPDPPFILAENAHVAMRLDKAGLHVDGDLVVPASAEMNIQNSDEHTVIAGPATLSDALISELVQRLAPAVAAQIAALQAQGKPLEFTSIEGETSTPAEEEGWGEDDDQWGEEDGEPGLEDEEEEGW